ncbi:phosphotransferase [Modestobacter marinus]|uniref:phosphotransferase n=1 Tax=Modestobacter marinus TaxID=477641 RepID=UPI001C959C1F|nr:phosphotransferase [Modestobacter marinus]
MTTGTAAGPGPAAQARRAERLAIAASLLESPPPLEELGPGRVVVRAGSVVHPSRSRPVVRWELTVDAGSGPAPLAVIGKGYRKGGGEEAGRLLRQLRRAGFDHPRLQVPAPFGFDPVRRVLAQEEAPPTTLRSLLDGDPGRAAPVVAQVGRWLARLHGVTGVDVPVLVEDFERGKLTEYASALAEVLPHAEDRLRSLTERTLDGLARDTGPRVVTHGDFQPGNIHLGGNRVVVIDFDRAAYAPAARDLGHFIGQTLTMGASRHGSLDAATPWVGAFLRGYATAGGDRAAVAAASTYVARTFAEVLFYRLVVRPMRDWSFVPAWLDAWEAALDGVVRSSRP